MRRRHRYFTAGTLFSGLALYTYNRRPKMESEAAPTEKEFDIFRDSPVRYLGYTNEVGESFRHIYPWFVIPSYVISFSYVLSDTVSKALK